MRLFAALCLALMCVAQTGFSQDALKSLDVFGSQQVDASDIQENWGQEFEVLAELLRTRQPEAFERKKAELTEVAGRSGVYAFVNVEVVESWHPEYGIHVTVDLVDPVDEDERLSFDVKPDGSPNDPEGLIALWREYDRVGQRIRDTVGLTSKSCTVFYCKWGYGHSDLSPFGDTFRAGVVPNEEAIRTVLLQDGDPANRRSALYLLAHIRSQKALLAILLESLNDSNHIVRTASLEMLASIADKRPDLVSVDPIIRHLNAPSTIEREQAIRVLEELSGPHKNRETILREGGTFLVSIMQLEQPSNSDPAYLLLQKLSGRKDLSKYDITSWTSIAEQARPGHANAESPE